MSWCVKNSSVESFTPEDRRNCEIRLHRILAWVGIQCPETLDIPGGRVHLRNFICGLLSKNRLSSKDLEEATTFQRSLQEMRLKKEKELETLELTVSEGEKLCCEIAGLIRAIDTLKDLPKMRKKRGIHQEFKENRIKDGKRWIKYLEEIKK